MATDYLKRKETCFGACLKSNFLYCFQFHNLYVNTTAIHNMNKDLILDVHSQHWNWYIKRICVWLTKNFQRCLKH